MVWVHITKTENECKAWPFAYSAILNNEDREVIKNSIEGSTGARFVLLEMGHYVACNKQRKMRWATDHIKVAQ